MCTCLVNSDIFPVSLYLCLYPMNCVPSLYHNINNNIEITYKTAHMYPKHKYEEQKENQYMPV